MKLQVPVVLLYLLSTSLASSAHRPTVYLIRHGEKPKHGNGMSADGIKRSSCLVDVFGAQSTYNIHLIMAQKPKSDGRRKRPYDTVHPLAKSLGLKVDTSCDRDDMKCVRNVIKKYKGRGNVLICWEHKRLTDILIELGMRHPPKYPGKKYDLIWEVPPDYSRVASIKSQECPKLDVKLEEVMRQQGPTDIRLRGFHGPVKYSEQRWTA